MSNNCSIIGFDGVSYTFPSIPDKVYNYKHFILFKHSVSNSFLIWGFNTNSFRMFLSSDNTYMYLDFGESTEFIQCILNFKYSNSWKVIEENATVKDQDGSFNVIYSSESLLSFKDTLVTKAFDLEIPEIPVVTYTLRPIVEEQNISSLDIFGETFGILPVLLVVLISYLGVRKFLDWLFNLLRRS